MPRIAAGGAPKQPGLRQTDGALQDRGFPARFPKSVALTFVIAVASHQKPRQATRWANSSDGGPETNWTMEARKKTRAAMPAPSIKVGNSGTCAKTEGQFAEADESQTNPAEQPKPIENGGGCRGWRWMNKTSRVRHAVASKNAMPCRP